MTPDDPPLTIALLGASGRTGRSVLAEALERGHRVRALARAPGSLPDAVRADHRVTVVEGDATRADDVGRAVAGADAVISVLGHAPGAPDDVLSTAAGHTVAACRSHGVRRLVALTSAAVDHPMDRPRWTDRLVRGLLRRLQPTLHLDSVHMAETLKGSGLDWTVVRAARITDAPATGSAVVGPVGVTGPTVRRGDVARFLVDLAEGDDHVGDMPAISN